MRPEKLGVYYESILEKEVRKECGIYYTPPYIVDYIVKNTVGRFLEDKTPKEAAKIKIVDPACGAGIFLLGAYQYLLDWHAKHSGKLTLAKRRKLLTENIFGVDIDPLAVEITKYCLSMKCTAGKDYSLELDENIKSGNSLIGLDFYDKELNFGEERTIKPFSWQKNFPEVFKQDGFDCVIGNPPYRTLQLGKNQESQDKTILNYYQSHYDAAFEYKVNLFALFIERGVSLATNDGYLSFIVPNSLYNTTSFKSIRKFMLESGRFDVIMDLRYKVFGQTETGGNAVFVYSKTKEQRKANVITLHAAEDFANPTIHKVFQKEFLSDPDFNLRINKGASKILETIRRHNGIVELGSIIKIYQGIITGDNKQFLSNRAKTGKWKPILNSTFANLDNLYKPREYEFSDVGVQEARHPVSWQGVQ